MDFFREFVTRETYRKLAPKSDPLAFFEQVDSSAWMLDEEQLMTLRHESPITYLRLKNLCEKRGIRLENS